MFQKSLMGRRTFLCPFFLVKVGDGFCSPFIISLVEKYPASHTAESAALE